MISVTNKHLTAGRVCFEPKIQNHFSKKIPSHPLILSNILNLTFTKLQQASRIIVSLGLSAPSSGANAAGSGLVRGQVQEHAGSCSNDERTAAHLTANSDAM